MAVCHTGNAQLLLATFSNLRIQFEQKLVCNLDEVIDQLLWIFRFEPAQQLSFAEFEPVVLKAAIFNLVLVTWLTQTVEQIRFERPKIQRFNSYSMLEKSTQLRRLLGSIALVFSGTLADFLRLLGSTTVLLRF